MTMTKQYKAFAIALTLGIALLLDGAWVQTVEAQVPPSTDPATSAGPPPDAAVSVPGSRVPRIATASRGRRAGRFRGRRRYRQALRLPAITQYGIPRLHVKAAYVVDANNRVLFEKNPERILPIASLTKLVTT